MPFVKPGTVHAVLPAKRGGRNTALHLAQPAHDPGVCETCLLDRKLSVHPAENIRLPHALKIGSDYATTEPEVALGKVVLLLN